MNGSVKKSMNYLMKLEYEIVPDESFSVVRNCSSCGRKTNFINIKKFRVNANGNKVDVWLIYQCENCKHSYNLSIYERKSPSLIPKSQYERFLSNDELLAEEYGKELQLFRHNKAVINYADIKYHFKKLNEQSSEAENEGVKSYTCDHI